MDSSDQERIFWIAVKRSLKMLNQAIEVLIQAIDERYSTRTNRK